jgi:broad specificity phosphatase PhoE/ubiquinone/menaquinone biosynthesis C-methylase UbiE
MTAPPAPATHLIFVRHAQSLHNRDGQGGIGPDHGLTELGWRQAQAAGGWLAARSRPAAVVSSPLVRALQTAEVIAARLELPVVVHEGLEEADFYFWDELRSRWDHPLSAWGHDWQPDSDTAPLYSSFRARLHDSLERLLSDYAGRTVVAVTHGGAIGTILRSLFGGHRVAVHTENTGISQVTWDVDHWRLMFHNNTAHLDALSTPRSAPPAPATASAGNGQQLEAIQKHYQRVASALPHNRAAPSAKELAELVRLAAPGGDDRVLDVGTGSGSVALAFAPLAASVMGLDVSPAMLERAEAARATTGVSNVYFRLGEIGGVPLEDGSFDIVVCHDVFQYAPDLPGLLKRLRRLLIPGGRLVADALVASDDPVRRATHNAIEVRRDPGIADVCSASDLERDIVASGFRIVKLERYGVSRELDEWLGGAAADEATRSAVRQMVEAGLEADSAGLAARRSREGQIVFTESRARLVAVAHDRPG